MTDRIRMTSRRPNEKLFNKPSYNEIVQQELDAFELRERALSREDRREREQKLMGDASRSKLAAPDRDLANLESPIDKQKVASARAK
jgi:hypothetical protein